MKIALSADWHLRGKDLDAADDQLEEMHHRMLDEDVKILAIAGDIFHSSAVGDRDAPTGAVAQVAIARVSAMAEDIGILMIPGNHDLPGVGGSPALHVFDAIPDVMIAHQPHTIQMRGPSFMCLPWGWSGNAEEAALNLPAGDVFLAHVRVVGARTSPHGSMVWETREGSWQITRDVLDRIPCNHVALGDFHTRQELCQHGGYVGSLRQLNHGESGNPVGFEIYDTESQETTWVDLTAAPKYHTLRLQADMSWNTLEIPDGNVRIIVDGTQSQGDIRQMEERGLTVLVEIPRVERLRRAAVPDGVLQSPRELIGLWADTQEPPITEERRKGMTVALASLSQQHSQSIAV